MCKIQWVNGSASQTSWTDQLNGPVLFIWSLGQFAYSRIDISVCTLSQLPSPMTLFSQCQTKTIIQLFILCILSVSMYFNFCVLLVFVLVFGEILMLKRFYNLSCSCIHLCFPNIVMLFNELCVVSKLKERSLWFS